MTHVEWVRVIAPGLGLAAVLAAAAAFLAQSHGGPVVLYALLLGMPFQFLSLDPRLGPGIQTAARDVLRLGVALLGARITLEQVLAVGAPVIAAVTIAVAVTILMGLVLARALGLPGRFGVLSAGATAICGASAAAAISSVLPRYPDLERDTAFTIVGVTTLSTVAMVVYPALAKTIGLDEVSTGIFIGATIHDVAQVVGAGYSVSVPAGDVATIVKLFRVALLLPVVVLIAVIARRMAGTSVETRTPLVPWFLAVFALLVAANSVGVVPVQVGHSLGEASRWCIIVAIAALGLKTALQSFFAVGRPAIAMMLLETVFIATLFLALIIVIR